MRAELIWSSVTSDYGYWRQEVTFTSTSEAIYIPSGAVNLSVAIHPAGGASSRIEYTLSTKDKIASNTAKWLVWPLGNNTDSRADKLLSSVTAIRGVSSGSATVEVIGS